MSNIAITPGSGVSSVATETIGGNDYQQVKIVDGTAASTNKWKVNADGSAQVSILGTPAVTFSGSPSISGAVTVVGNVGASVIGSVPVSVMGGTIGISGIPNIQGKDAPIASITGNPVYISGKDANGSVAGVQVIGGAVLTIGSVSGSVGIVGTPSVSGTVNVGNTITINSPSVYGNVSGSVVGFQGGAWTTSVVGTVTASIQGNVNVASVVGAVSPYAQSNALVSGVSSVMYGTGSVLVLAAPASPNKNYVTHILATNDGASDTIINVVDNGNVIYAGYAAKSGGGFSATFPAPLKQPTSVLALYAQSTVASSVLVSMSGYTAS